MCSAAPAASRSAPTSCYAEVRTAAPYAGLTRADFDAVVDFVATGGYALKSYERFAKIRQGQDGRWRVANPRVAQRYRLNVGTIVEADMLKVRLVRARGGGSGYSGAIARGGKLLGEVEEYFIETMVPGDTFVFAGEILRYEALVEDEVYVSRTSGTDPKVPSYEGGKFPLSTYLADRVRRLLSDPRPMGRAARHGARLARHPAVALAPAGCGRAPGRDLSARRPALSRLLSVRRTARAPDARHAADAAARARAACDRSASSPTNMRSPSGGSATWALAIERGELSLAALFDQDMLGDDLEAWLAESALMKRTFRNCAIIAGLIERRFPGEEKSRRQLTISTDLVYDVLRKHQPDHVLLRAARADAATGLLDVRRLGEMLSRIQGRIIHKAARPRVAARRPGDAGDRPRDGLRRGLRRAAGRGGGRTGQGGDGGDVARMKSGPHRPRNRPPALHAGYIANLSPALRVEQ